MGLILADAHININRWAAGTTSCATPSSSRQNSHPSLVFFTLIWTHFTCLQSAITQKLSFIHSEHINPPFSSIFNLPKSPSACRPDAVEPSLSSTNHCLCQQDLKKKESSSGRQMWAHQRCPAPKSFLSMVRMGALACFYTPARQNLNSRETLLSQRMPELQQKENTHLEYICTPKSQSHPTGLPSNYVHKDEKACRLFVIAFIWIEGNGGAISAWLGI